MATTKKKWWLVLDPQGYWAFQDPIEAVDEQEAIRIADTDFVKDPKSGLENRWRVIEVVSPTFKDFRATIEVTPV